MTSRRNEERSRRSDPASRRTISQVPSRAGRWLELLVASILSSTSEHDIRSLDPYMSSLAYKTVTSLTVIAMLTSIRISQTRRAFAP